MLADHLWIVVGKWAWGCRLGYTIEFEAKVTAYEKGYRGHRDLPDAPSPSTDFRLERPTKVVIVDRGEP